MRRYHALQHAVKVSFMSQRKQDDIHVWSLFRGICTEQSGVSPKVLLKLPFSWKSNLGINPHGYDLDFCSSCLLLIVFVFCEVFRGK